MDADHPPVEILRLGARAAALVGLYAGAVRLFSLVPSLTLGLPLLFWGLLAGVLLTATAVAVLRPRHEMAAGGALVAAAALATLAGGGIRVGAILGWAHGYALLFLAAGLFLLSAAAWSRREAALRPRPVAHEDAEHVDGV